MATPTDLTLVAQAIASQRSALLAYGDDLTFAQCRAINETSGFTFERDAGQGRILRVAEYHLTDTDLETAYRRSWDFLW